ncbi:M42 family metallopeptidase [Bacillaceae bacterium S4-13-58]
MSNKSQSIIEILGQLVSIPSPSGYTSDVIRFCENLLRSEGIYTERNAKGALIATIEGQNKDQQRLLTAHVDTLGAMVKEIKSDGRLSLSMIGGFRWNSVEGEYCTIHSSNDQNVTGTILIHQTSVHVYKNAGDVKRNEENIEVRLDEKVKSANDVRSLGIEVGDFVSFDPRYQVSESGFVKSRHLDDKASAAILLQLVISLRREKVELPYTTNFYFSNNEEIGYGGNASLPSQTVEYIAVDMGAIGDGQSSSEFDVSICAKDSSGPYHYLLRKQLSEIAKRNKLPYTVDIYPYYGSDASAAIRSGYDIRHGLIGPGIDASHAFERTHESSLIATYDLIYHYLQEPMISE